MGDAAASRHQVDLPGLNQLFVTQAVAMQHLALDHPRECLQADVRVRADVEALARRIVHWAGVVEEAPGADHAPVPVRNRAPNLESVANDRATRLQALRLPNTHQSR